ncbi:MAG: bifunctional DNA-formamidopyrimidine glycosylase/DNA-(apurinic or apyrimidinic site) lyase [Polyangiaceae bacterium]|nr:bifunctional DNA-formamidopyrimidine glycosylase/DNA-(apurinic or apyrimidinic site) lyase [Polyangiaceae bacterium]
MDGAGSNNGVYHTGAIRSHPSTRPAGATVTGLGGGATVPGVPELPEVEVTRRRVAPLLVDREIATVETTKPSGFFLTPPATLRRRLVGRRVTELGRHGKYLIGGLDDGSRLLLHLGMTGQLVSASARSPRLFRVSDRHPMATDPWRFAGDRHTHLRLGFRDLGEEVWFRDPRRFGRVEWLAPGAVSPRLAKLGLDALVVDPAAFCAVIQRRRAPLKALLLDQSLLAGVGNIYADEALFRARLHPLRSGTQLSHPAALALLASIQGILLEAIDRGGTSISDFVAPDGTDGGFSANLRVYQRAGMPCLICGTVLMRIVVRGRSTHFCPRCQR